MLAEQGCPHRGLRQTYTGLANKKKLIQAQRLLWPVKHVQELLLGDYFVTCTLLFYFYFIIGETEEKMFQL